MLLYNCHVGNTIQCINHLKLNSSTNNLFTKLYMICSTFANKNESLQKLFTLINFETLKLVQTGALQQLFWK